MGVKKQILPFRKIKYFCFEYISTMSCVQSVIAKLGMPGWLSEEHAALDPRVVSSSPTLGKKIT